jgi:hypothetical protein
LRPFPRISNSIIAFNTTSLKKGTATFIKRTFLSSAEISPHIAPNFFATSVVLRLGSSSLIAFLLSFEKNMKAVEAPLGAFGSFFSFLSSLDFFLAGSPESLDFDFGLDSLFLDSFFAGFFFLSSNPDKKKEIHYEFKYFTASKVKTTYRHFHPQIHRRSQTH